MNSEPVGLLIVRVWVEPNSAKPARVQLRTTTDPAAGFTCTQTVADLEEALDAIRAFLTSALANEKGGSHRLN